MTEQSTRGEASLPRNRADKRRWLRPATGVSAHRVEEHRQQTTTSLSVIVPAYNEQYLVEASLERLKILETSPLLHRVQVVVVDDGSKDATAQAIGRFRNSLESDRLDGKLQWTWLRHDKNQGKGAAIRTALAHVESELVVIHDADLEYHPWDLLQMIELFLYEDADAVFGSRFMSGGHKRALFFRHALGNKLLTFLCDLVSDLNLTDMETCYKMIRADLLKSIPLESSTFDVEPELAIKLAKRGALFGTHLSRREKNRVEGRRTRIMGHPPIRRIKPHLRRGCRGRRNSGENQSRSPVQQMDGGRREAPRGRSRSRDRGGYRQYVREPHAALHVLGDGRKPVLFELSRSASSLPAVYERGLHRWHER